MFKPPLPMKVCKHAFWASMFMRVGFLSKYFQKNVNATLGREPKETQQGTVVLAKLESETELKTHNTILLSSDFKIVKKKKTGSWRFKLKVGNQWVNTGKPGDTHNAVVTSGKAVNPRFIYGTWPSSNNASEWNTWSLHHCSAFPFAKKCENTAYPLTKAPDKSSKLTWDLPVHPHQCVDHPNSPEHALKYPPGSLPNWVEPGASPNWEGSAFSLPHVAVQVLCTFTILTDLYNSLEMIFWKQLVCHLQNVYMKFVWDFFLPQSVL